MGRIRRGWGLTRKSWRVLKANRGLAIVPLYAAIASGAAVLVVVLPGLLLIDGERVVAGAVVVACGLYAATYLAIFFMVALAAMADAALRDEEASIRDGLAVARSRALVISGWTLMTVTVNLMISALSDEGNPIVKILAGAMAAAWSLITFLVVPILALEGVGPIDALKRSAALFRERWGEQIGGTVAIGGIVLLVGVLPSVALGTVGVLLWLDVPGELSSAIGILMVVAGVLGVVLSLVVQSAIRQVFAVALYRFLGEGETSGPFGTEDFERAVRPRGRAARARLGAA